MPVEGATLSPINSPVDKRRARTYICLKWQAF